MDTVATRPASAAAAARTHTTARQSANRRIGKPIPALTRASRVELTGGDRRLHKLVCKQWADFQERPNENVRRVILLPADESKPKFLWMPTQAVGNSPAVLDGNDIIAPRGSSTSATAAPLWKEFSDSENLPKSASLVLHRRYTTDCAPNKCVASMLGSAVACRWRGPLVICTMLYDHQGGHGTAGDIDSSAFTFALHLMAHYHSGKYMPIEKTRGLKISVSAPFIEEIDVPLKHPVFKSGSPMPIMEKLCWPTHTYKFPAADVQTGSVPETSGNTNNTPADLAPLRVCIDPSSVDFGRVPNSFLDDNASVLVARADKSKCDTHLILMVITLIRDHIVDSLVALPPTVEAREDALRQLTEFQTKVISGELGGESSFPVG